jgi:hypothetical protein
MSVCDDFMVTFGGWPRQTVDADRNYIPDPGGAVITGPSGLQVDGTMAQHTGIFLHELGHTMGLRHGGRNDINWKPNYLSIMNYRFAMDGLTFDFNGDMRVDRVNRDFNHDGLPDLRSFSYSATVLPTLDERPTPGFAGLDESDGISDQNTLTQYTCPVPAALWVNDPWARGTGPIDWNCDGVLNSGVSPTSTRVIPAWASRNCRGSTIRPRLAAPASISASARKSTERCWARASAFSIRKTTSSCWNATTGRSSISRTCSAAIK